MVSHRNGCRVLLQKRIIRLLSSAKRLDHTNKLFYNVHILNLLNLFKLKTAIIIFKAYSCVTKLHYELS